MSSCDSSLPPTDTELFERQRALQGEARELLAQTDLLPLLRLVGTPHVIGSFVYGLMVWRDLDVVILAPDLSGQQLAPALAPLLGHPWLRELHYTNETGPHSPSADPGDQRHYVVCYLETDSGRRWKLDLSFWTAAGRRGELEHPAWLEATLTAETRLAILRLKDRWYRRPEYPYTVGGSDIYDAVINHGVRTEDELARYLAERGLPAPATGSN